MKNFLLVLILTIVSTTQSFATDPLIDDQFNTEQTETFETVQGNIMSPYCPGRLLKDCPSTAARDLKLSIKERILNGDEANVIIEDLLEEYGEEMRAAPKVEGVGILAWVAPILFLLVGFCVVICWVRSQNRNQSSSQK